MKKILFSLILVLFSTLISVAQVDLSIIEEHHSENTSLVKYAFISEYLDAKSERMHFIFKTPMDFTSFGLSWSTTNINVPPGDFKIIYRVHKNGVGWSDRIYEEGLVSPVENGTGKYLSDLLFGIDEMLHDSLEITFISPDGIKITGMNITLLDVSKIVDKNRSYKNVVSSGAKSCPEFPAMIPRSEWCQGNNACLNPSYTPTTINPTHIVVHHGAGSTSYTDSYALIYSYWNYHVNSNMWADIGYNYVFDKYGNFFQGRHNPNLPSTDIRGAHAGAANSASIGINYLGNSDIDLPTQSQNQKAAEFMAWWFDYRSFDPNSSAQIYCQDEQTRTVPRICGHKDVYPGGTACPGNALYSELPNLRNITSEIIDYCNDPIPPESNIILNRNWYAENIDIVFEDADNEGGAGVKYSFYQIMDFDGIEWRANSDYGFFNDNFNIAIHQEWTEIAGTWSVNNGHLLQTDQNLSNTNIYANLTQTTGNTYLYHWQMKISGSGSNKRAGMHFFCSSPEENNRGNSYMMFLRADGNKSQLYKYVNNVYTLVSDDITTVNEDQWYDIKIIFNAETGEMNAYKDNQLVSQWTDPNPFESGNSISLRTADCTVEYDDVKVYLSRGNNVTVSAGSTDCMIRYQSVNHTTEAGRVRTILIDNAGNWSQSVSENLFIDVNAPESEFILENDWFTDDFSISFEDSDQLSGIETSFFSVIDFDGLRWMANADLGFYFDEFESVGSEWVQQSGTWQANNGILIQTDETNSNTNIHTFLKQDLSEKYLYEFDIKLDGSNTNKRAGFHYFCDNPELSNRGNSYFIWFREATKDLEFYKVINNSFSLKKHYKIDFDSGAWYNVKLIFDREKSNHYVYINDIPVGEWKDSEPFSAENHSNHSYVSFRSGNCILNVDNLKIYRSRNIIENISMGTQNSMIRFQNQNPESYATQIHTIVTDSAKNLSQNFYKSLKIDYTPPSLVEFVNDGDNEDVDFVFDLNQISANWGVAIDENSGIAAYLYAVGTEPGQADFVEWTNIGNNLNVFISDIELTNGHTYYFSVKAVNGAGLVGDIVSSDGFLVESDVFEKLVSEESISIYPNPNEGWFYVQLGERNGPANLSVFDVEGKLIYKKYINYSAGKDVKIDIGSNKGVFFLKIDLSRELFYTKLIVL